MPELNKIGKLLQELGDDKRLLVTNGGDWTLHEYQAPDSGKVGILTLNTVFGSIDTVALTGLDKVRTAVEGSDLEGVILVNPHKGKDQGNAVLSAGASLTELLLFIQYGHGTDDWSKVTQHMEHGQSVFTAMFESPKPFYAALLDANTYGGGTEYLCDG